MKGWDILKRAWSTLWRYRALWVIGTILGLTTLSCNGILLMGGGDPSMPKTEEHGFLMPLPSGARITVPGRGEKDEGPGRLIFNYRHAADSVPLFPGDVVVSYNPPDRLSVNVGTRQRNGSQTRTTYPVEPATVRLIKSGLAAAAAEVTSSSSHRTRSRPSWASSASTRRRASGPMTS